MSSKFDQVVDQLQIGTLPREAQEEIIGKLDGTILQATIVTIAEHLTPRELRKFEQFMDAADDPVAAIQMFVGTQAPQLAPLLERVHNEEVEKFRQVIADLIRSPK